MEGKNAIDLKPGKYSLNEIQRDVQSKKISLSELSLESFQDERPTEALRNVGVIEDKDFQKKGVEAVRNLQANEPFRAFMELLLNSVDYSKGNEPISVRVAEREDGGWQIVIQDKPDGTGMSAEQFLNTYLDAYASGSAKDRNTPLGKPKKGFMGVGAQQQFSLLQNKGDKIWISVAKDDEIVVSEFEPVLDEEKKVSDITMTIGGRRKNDKKIGLKRGVSQVIQLSKETCEKIGFSPENFGAYLSERLSSMEGSDVEMVVTQKAERGVQDVTFSTGKVSSEFSSSLKNYSPKGKESQKEQFENARGVKKERYSYQISSKEKSDAYRVKGETVTILASKEKSDESFVYFNVLGVRVGDPVVVHGKNLPREIDLRFERAIETITEGRRASGVTEEDVKDLIGSIDEIAKAKFSEDPKENARLRLVLLSALSPIYEKYEEGNRWKDKQRRSITEKFKKRMTNSVKEAIENSTPVVPSDIDDQVEIVNPDVIYINSRFITDSQKGKSLELCGFRNVDKLPKNVFIGEFSSDNPIFFSESGLIFINNKYFEQINDFELLKIRAISINFDQMQEGKRKMSIAIEENVLPLQEIIKPGEVVNYKERFMRARDLFVDMKNNWSTMNFQEKKEKIDKWTEIVLKEEFIKFQKGIDEDVTPKWHRSRRDFSENELDNFFSIFAKFDYDLMCSGNMDTSSMRAFDDFFFDVYNTNSHFVFSTDILAQIRIIYPNYDERLINKVVLGTINTIIDYRLKSYHPAIVEMFTDAKKGISNFDFNLKKDELGQGRIEFLEGDNKESFERDLVIISTNAVELADVLKIKSEHRDDFIDATRKIPDMFSKVMASDEFPDILSKVWSCYKRNPDKIVEISRFIENYSGDVLRNVFRFTNYFGFLEKYSFEELENEVLPLIKLLGINNTYNAFLVIYAGSVAYSETQKDREDFYIEESKLNMLLQILNTGNVEMNFDSPQIADSNIIFSPGLLPLLKSVHLTDEFSQSADPNVYLREQFEGNDKSKIDNRRRSMMHPILHLDPTPGSSFFEVLKNSWQAISRTEGADRNIDIHDFISRDEKNDQSFFGFEIEDHVGMDPRDALFKLLVPGYGEGVHGLHFLTILKDVDFCEVETSLGGKKGKIFLEAVRNEKGDLIDFKSAYKEEENPDGFKGTKVKGWKKIQAEQVQVEAGIFRMRMKEFSQNVPAGRAQILLNEEQINPKAVVFGSQIEIMGVGKIEFKPNSGGGVSLSIEDIPRLSANIAPVIQKANIPEKAKQIFQKSGLTINLASVDIKCGITRDGGGFQNEGEVNLALQKSLEENYGKIISEMLANGEIDFSEVVESEVWTDVSYANRYAKEKYSKELPKDWSDKNEVYKWALTSEVFEISGQKYSLARIISENLSGNGLSLQVLETLPEKIKAKLVEGKSKLQSVDSVKEEPFVTDLDLPPDVIEYMKRITSVAEESLGIIDRGEPEIKMHRGKVRGMANVAMYSPLKDQYSWNENTVSVVRRAMAGSLNAQAEILEIAIHEAEHRKRRQAEEIFAHSTDFYKGVENGILHAKISI